ncbi:MAG: hypothetical protein HY890_04040 [Deltaproteobacteria bacterium]|nr:hypothetical protein [Deltaproteobacteria bacterium]
MVFDHIEEKEAVKRAALIERNGITFYSLLLEKLTDRRIKSVLKKLIRDEKKHLRAMEERYFPEAGLMEDEITEEEIEIERYVKRLGVPDLFARRINIEKLVAAIDEPKKALLIALDAENHSLEFFKEMARLSRTADGRKMYLELADEEKEHIGHISELLEAIGN